jgi:hypothetical protein
MALSQMSTLIVQQQKFNLFKEYLDSTPLLKQVVAEHDHPFFVQLCRDIWFSLCEQRHEPILNADAAIANPIRYSIVKQFVSHPTYHCLYDLSHEEGNNTLVNAVVIADFLTHWLVHELEGRTFDNDQQRLHYILELVSMSQAIEGAAQFLAHMQPALKKERDLCDFLLLDFHEQAHQNALILLEVATAGVTRHLYKAKYVYQSIA